jgi:hypothetical protein
MQATPSPYTGPAALQKSSGGCGRTMLIVIGVISVVMVCCLAVAGGGYFLFRDQFISAVQQIGLTAPSGAPVEVPTLPASQKMAPTPTLPEAAATQPAAQENPATPTLPEATATLLATQARPQATPTTAAKSEKNIQVDYTDGWKLANTSQYLTDITQQGSRVISVKQAGLTVAVLPDTQPAPGVGNYFVKAHISTLAPGQRAGIRCYIQDEKNYYQIELKDNNFAIGKVLDGKLIPLTGPYWQKSQFMKPEGMVGGVEVELFCSNMGLGISIEGTEETPLIADPDASFTSGEVAIFAAPADKPTGEFYSSVIFSSFSVELQ